MERDRFEVKVEQLRSTEDFKRNEMLFAVLLAVVAALLMFRVGSIAHTIEQPHSIGVMYINELIAQANLDHLSQVGPPLVALFYFWHMWIYYSQILFYVEDTRGAQVLTTITAVVAIVSSAFVLPFTRLWPLAFAVGTAALFVKTCHLKVQTKKIKDHPFNTDDRCPSWVWSSALGTIFFAGMGGLVLFYPNLLVTSLVCTLIMGAFTLKYIVFYPSYKKRLQNAMRAYWGYTNADSPRAKSEVEGT